MAISAASIETLNINSIGATANAITGGAAGALGAAGTGTSGTGTAGTAKVQLQRRLQLTPTPRLTLRVLRTSISEQSQVLT